MPRYTVKVKKGDSPTYLWGGQEVKAILKSPLYFTFRVVDMGEPIDFGISTPENTTNDIGVLNANETFTIHLNDISGIYARCRESVDTQIECSIEGISISI